PPPIRIDYAPDLVITEEPEEFDITGLVPQPPGTPRSGLSVAGSFVTAQESIGSDQSSAVLSWHDAEGGSDIDELDIDGSPRPPQYVDVTPTGGSAALGDGVIVSGAQVNRADLTGWIDGMLSAGGTPEGPALDLPTLATALVDRLSELLV